ncbi:MAG: DUF4870 domain-containing protein [Pyrinomonadaceae bacterium]|nr:DUF4870 domain-containing protein [Pyrinomonadaceae bacterium]
MSEHGKSTFDMDANLVALLCYLANFVCYLGLILSIITVIQDKDNKLARFHAFQSIFLTVLAIVLIPVYFIVGFIGGMIDSALGFPILSLLMFLIVAVIGLALFVFMVLAAIKGFGGEMYKIPVIGNIAEKYV